MDRALEQILLWAQDRPYWERLLLDELFAKGTLAETTITEAAEYLLASEGLTSSKTEKKLPTLLKLSSPSESSGKADRLLSIQSTQNVNALSTDQPMEFAEGLTVIYGENGSGKSGYARILSTIGFCRHRAEILPNLATGATDKCKASVLFTDGGEPLEAVLNLKATDFHLPFMKVFDNESVPIQLDKTNAFSFTPLSLEILTLLSDATDQVRSIIVEQARERGEPADYSKFFEGDSPITEYIADLNHETNVLDLRELGAFSAVDKKQLDELEDKITMVRKKEYDTKISAIDSLVQDLSALDGRLRDVSAAVCCVAVTEAVKAATEHRLLIKRLQDHKIDDLSHAAFSHTGSRPWIAFVQRARELGVLEYPPDAIPKEGQPCLLCQQSLGSREIRLYRSLWDYLSAQSTERLGQLKTTVSSWIGDVKGLDTAIWREDSAIRRVMKDQFEQFEQVVTHYVDQVREIVQAATEQPVDPWTLDLTGFRYSITTAAVRNSLSEQRAKLKEAKQTDNLVELEASARRIKHKKQLSQMLDELVARVKELKWSQKARSIGGTTRPITSKYNSLFDELVTDSYKTTFTKLLKQFSRQVSVSLTTQGRKGTTVKRVRLYFGDEELPAEAPRLVLSEGEQKAVALSDFLSEAIVDEGCNCIVLDDPVNSFDHKWIEAASSVLCSIASNKQVIVFTHSVIFLHFLKEWAKKAELEPRYHWVQKLAPDEIGVVSLDELPGIEGKYISAAPVRSSIDRASKAKGEAREEIIRQGFGQLRTCYEVMVYRDVFNRVVSRWEEHIKMGNLREVVATDQFLVQIDSEFQELSRFIEGHSHSDQYVQVRPSLEILKERCDLFETLKSQIKAARRSKAKKAT